MKFVILTGMSGAGKSTAIKMMEDIGFYCVDNLPIPLLEKFVELTTLQSAELQKVAVGIDIRSGQSFDELHGVLDHMKDNGVEYEILFLDAEDSVLVKRYKETRRNHPLAGGERVDKGIEEERKRLAFLKERADYIIDTSQLLTRELKAELDKIFIQNQDYKNLFITILSFGFKDGIPVDADLVVGVPESGNVAAMGYSMESGIPYGMAFVKNGYVGRTFIKPAQSSRESSVTIKLNALQEAVAGKRVIMIDDSIVRGTTSNRIVNMLREAGATEVHVRISSPPFLWPCYFGTDIPVREQLIAYNRTIEQIREVIGADSLGYLQIDRLEQMVDGLSICKGCFTGQYPMEPPTDDIRGDYIR